MRFVRTPRQMLGEQLHAMRLHEGFGFVQQLCVQRCRSTQREGQAVAHKRVAFGEVTQIFGRPASQASPVFGRNFKEVDDVWHAVFQRLYQFAAKAKACA